MKEASCEQGLLCKKKFVCEALIYSEGRYKLFFGMPAFPFGYRKCMLAVSENLLDWTVKQTVVKPRILELSSVNAGSAISRNGKTVYLYHKKSLFSESVRMLCTTDFSKFDKHPVAVLTPKSLPKKAKGLGAPKVVKCGDFYYMVIGSRVANGGFVLLYRSPNLIDWGYRGAISCETQKSAGRCDYPALVQADGVHLLFEERTKKHSRTFGYRLGSARLEEGCFTPFREFTALDKIASPRISTLPDGRTLLVGGLMNLDGSCTRLALPKEVTLEKGSVYLKPAREIYRKRQREQAYSFTARAPVTEIKEISGRRLELNVFADLSNSSSFRIMAYMTGCRGLFIRFDKNSRIAVFDAATLIDKNKKGEGVVKVPFDPSIRLDVQLFLLGDRFECFINGGERTVSRGLDARLTGTQIGFDAEGEVPCETVAYRIE